MAQNVQLASFIDPTFGENAYVVWRSAPGPCWIVDPGPPPSGARIVAHVRKLHLVPEAIVQTHAHADHIAGIPEVLAAFAELPILVADEERPALSEPDENLSSAIGAPFRVSATNVRSLAPGDSLTLDGVGWYVLDVSGHSPGGRALYCPTAAVVLVGDALFQGSIGRTDFHHSNHERLIRNIKNNLFSLPDETKVYSGHGPSTTIGAERRSNPFLQ